VIFTILLILVAHHVIAGPLVPLQQRKGQRDRLRKVTHIDYFPVYPKHPKDSVSMVGFPGTLKETASAVKAEEHTAATMSAVDVNSRDTPSTAQGMGQPELAMGSSDMNANEAATEHAPRGDSMVGATDLVESPFAYRLSFQEQSDLSMDGV
jgi:hypothetical protein